MQIKSIIFSNEGSNEFTCAIAYWSVQMRVKSKLWLPLTAGNLDTVLRLEK